MVTAHKWIEYVSEQGLVNPGTAVMYAELNVCRSSDKPHLHRREPGSILQRVRDEIAEQLLETMRIPIPLYISDNFKLDLSIG